MSGIVGYYNLTEWWLQTFSHEDIIRVKSTFIDEEDFHELTHGDVTYSSRNTIAFLENMANRMIRTKHYDLAKVFLSKAETLIEYGTPSEIHFLYRAFIEYYSEFSLKHNFEKQLEYALKQIDIADSASREIIDKSCYFKIAHRGYELYYDYLKANKKTEEAKALKAKARKEKWNFSYY
ncbi:MAG: hypothetical protein EOO46_11785 [Flavobacterium sp.]|nr:MAG: hypothetical protein EOO46_11785 [Flavobacterium sp.]